MSPLISLTSLLILFALLTGEALTAELTCEGASTKLVKLCVDFDSEVGDLTAFNEFHKIYRQVNECIIKKTDLETLSMNEQICTKNGIVFSSVERLGQLIERLLRLEPICTLEFASRFYELKRSLSSIESDGRNLMRIFSLLGHQMAGRCRKSLDGRLLEVEERAKDSLKHIQLINGLLIEPEKLIDLGELPAELFLPTLESEHLSAPSDPSPVAFEFNKIPPQAKIANDLVLGVSCKTLKLYHLNLLGSLGLLASLGFAAQPDQVSAQDNDLRLRRWLISALVCQSLRAATRFGQNAGGEYDVSLDEEFATEFAGFQLAEFQGAISQEESISVAQLRRRLNLRKLQFMNGLSYRLASTIYDYKLLKGRTDGLRLASNLIGRQVNPDELSNEGGNALTGSVLSSCRTFASSVKSLEAFADFHAKISQLNAHLRSPNLSEPSKAAQTVEYVCEENGITYAGLAQLGQLVERWLGADKSVCSQEFAARLVRTREQLFSIEQEDEPKLMTVLNLLANKLVVRCRSSLSKRLELIERSEPELNKHLLIVTNNLAEQDEIERLSGVVPVESYLPIMESELIWSSLSAKSARTELGFEFKQSQQVRTVLDSTRLSCKVLKPHQVNLLGSLGLLASAGYSAELAEGKAANLRLTRWIISAILCQSQLATSKVAGATKSADLIKIGHIEQADVELADEYSSNSAAIPEDDSEMNAATLVGNTKELTKFINLRKVQLIDGPNYELAKSIYNYLDLNKTDRVAIVSGLLGWDISEKVAKNDDEDDDDDED